MGKVKAFIMILIFILSVFFIIKGQIIKSYFGLLIMLAGLIGLVLNLYIYNKKYV